MKSIVGWMTALLFAIVLLAWGSGGRPPTAARAAAAASGPAVLDEWGARITMLGSSVGENSLRTQVRTTIAQLAMFDAVNAALDGRYRPFVSKPASPPGASPEAAAIRAAYVVAMNDFPSRAELIRSAYDASISVLMAGPDAIAAGVAIGDLAANAVLAARVGDHRNEPDLYGYVAASGPGAWIQTPPEFAPPLVPFLAFVTPFGYDDPDRFRPPPPPALDSKTYTADYNESKDVGSATNTSRTAEQSLTAAFWSPSATALWTANVRSLTGSMDLLTAARFQAIGIAALTNALIACWDAKYAYMFWRPVTAIRAGETDGNGATAADLLWTPALATPPHPEYPAAHTAVGAGALAFYTVWFNSDQLELNVRGANGVIRHYGSVSAIVAEEGDARVWGGMHWRNSTEVGTALGRKVGRYTATRLLKPVDE